MTAIAGTRRSKPERLMLRVGKGCLEPADRYTQERLRAKKFAIGDLVSAELKKTRNPKFNRLGHRIGQLCAANIEDFAGMDAHAVLKRLQIEARIGCEEIGIKVPGLGYCVQFVPKSLSFESMDEGEFQEVVKAFCRHIAKEYWKTLTPEQIEEMAESFVSEG